MTLINAFLLALVGFSKTTPLYLGYSPIILLSMAARVHHPIDPCLYHWGLQIRFIDMYIIFGNKVAKQINLVSLDWVLLRAEFKQFTPRLFNCLIKSTNEF